MTSSLVAGVGDVNGEEDQQVMARHLLKSQHACLPIVARQIEGKAGEQGSALAADETVTGF
ncbi:MAG: hypothetical protein V3R87_00775 [Dehalococcoidia bacterium]